MPTAIATTPYEAALRSVERKTGTKRTTLPAAKPSPSRKVAGGKKAVGPVQKAAAKIEADSKAKTEAIKRGTGNGSGPHSRLTHKWGSTTKRDVKVGDQVKTASGVVIKIIGRWTKRTKAGLVPMVTGEIVSLPKGATVAAEGKGKGNRLNAAASTVTHVK